MYRLSLKFNHIQPGLHLSCVMENVLYIDAHIYKSMLYAVFDCVSTVNDVLVYLIDYLFMYVWAFTQIQSYSTGPSPVVRHGKRPIYWRSYLQVDVVRSVWFNSDNIIVDPSYGNMLYEVTVCSRRWWCSYT